ncbi:hypothetical protein BJV78DRAFT_1357955, partial [Lactifluus subvellereus]
AHPHPHNHPEHVLHATSPTSGRAHAGCCVPAAPKRKRLPREGLYPFRVCTQHQLCPCRGLEGSRAVVVDSQVTAARGFG